ncbi:hypothetical protein F5Y16DRAFT_401696 [Xylariaceae sp. FL0255]|nr:hypothetical protein F5Y16DRAFT_401696 [Xylariaceae sp. FL0255]
MSETILLSSVINNSHKPSYIDPPPSSQHNTIFTAPRTSGTVESLFSSLIQPTWSTLWFTLLCIFVMFNLKNMPFMWHMRILNAFRFILRTQRPKVAVGPSHLFQPLITSSRAQLLEIDFYLHKSNSSYFSDVDIARTHLVCTLFAKGIETMRGGTEAYTGSKGTLFSLALGAVSCSFKKEVKPYEEYEMWSKLLTWDEKWIYIVTHFVKKDAAVPKTYSLYPEQSPAPSRRNSEENSDMDTQEFNTTTGDEEPRKLIHATALSKCVFKTGRRTIAPELMLEMSGLLPTKGQEDSEVEQEAIREQQRKGMEVARLLGNENQQKLEVEFEGDGCEALGRHSDGTGTAGVISTLMQLAKLKKSQLL